ncbi:HAD family phosphatase, partial [Parabacteroides sp. OttesenSCG-928-G21]|nr:HAD family phosphatase [Parabacteroides sp. OttesenSCG-928-G21]
MKTALFDFDGVIVDTEPIYDLFWEEAGKRYEVGIDNFVDIIKGTTTPDIIKIYFSNHPEAIQQKVFDECIAYEREMDLPAMPGSLEFLHLLKANQVKMGLVTSSDQSKINRAIALHNLQGIFDTIVTSEDITKGKPDPMCYLLAAERIQAAPQECLVFEDSFNGIKAGNAAGMRVIGLSTTNSAASLKDMVHQVIPDFQDITF